MGSHYGAALRKDRQLAESAASRMAADDQPANSWAPDDEVYDFKAEQLNQMIDRLGDLITAVINVNAERKNQIKPPPRSPRPVTEIDRARSRIENRIEADLDALIRAAHATYADENKSRG